MNVKQQIESFGRALTAMRDELIHEAAASPDAHAVIAACRMIAELPSFFLETNYEDEIVKQLAELSRAAGSHDALLRKTAQRRLSVLSRLQFSAAAAKRMQG